MNITRAKTTLKSYCNKNGFENPTYKLVSRSGKSLNKFYTIRVDVNGLSLANGEGISKRIARNKAAMCGLTQLRVLKIVMNTKELNSQNIGFTDYENKSNDNRNDNELKLEETELEIVDQLNDQQIECDCVEERSDQQNNDNENDFCEDILTTDREELREEEVNNQSISLVNNEETDEITVLQE